MKKIMMLLLLVILFQPILVDALVYETDFSDWQEVSSKVEDSSLIEGKEEKKYKFYQEEIVYSEDYIIKEHQTVEYPYQTDKWILTEFSDWKMEKPESYLERTIETKETYYYKNAKKVSSINLYNVDGTDDKLWITEIEILYQDEKIPYVIECDTCDEEFKSRIQNNIIYEDAVFLNQKEELKLVLDKEYEIKDLVFHIYIGDTKRNKLTTYQLGVNDEKEEPYVNAVKKYWTISTPGGAALDRIVLKDYIETMKWEEKIEETENKIENDAWIKIVDIKNYYRYQDRKYLYYRIDRNYLDDYYFEKEGYIKDENDYVPVYYKRQKERIIVNDNIEITKNYLDLDDIFIESTIPYSKMSIQNNINWDQSGVYQVHVTYQDLEFDVPVKVVVPINLEVIPVINQEVKQKIEETTLEQTESKEEIIQKETAKQEEKVNGSQKGEPEWQKYINLKNISLLFLFFLGLFLFFYGLNKIVERKK